MERQKAIDLLEDLKTELWEEANDPELTGDELYELLKNFKALSKAIEDMERLDGIERKAVEWFKEKIIK